PGQIVEFKGKLAKVAGKIPVKDVLVDGLGIGDVGNVVLRDRQTLAKDGIAIVLLTLDRIQGKLTSDPEVISRGFVYEGKNKRLLAVSGNLLSKELARKPKLDAKIARDAAIEFLERYFFETTMYW
ncbi:MAG: Beta-lactamase domain-containing protein, partial [Candidatus Woesebacteria bacterium GW2011_GWC2_47_16]